MRKMLAIITVFALVLVIRNILLSLQNATKNQQTITDLKAGVDRKKAENNFLEQELYYVKSNEFVEKEAREKLGLVKQGEYIVILPLLKTKTSQKAISLSQKANWEKWKDLLF